MARLAPAVGLVVALASCAKPPANPPTFPVNGRVLYEGKPASGAVVIFHLASGPTTADRPRGKADNDGAFTLGTFTANDGAPAGEYIVTIEWRRTDDHPEQGEDLLPAAYGDPALSKIRATVTTGANDPLTLKLTRKP